MSTITLRRIKDDFIVACPDIAPAKFRAGAKQKAGAQVIIRATRSGRTRPNELAGLCRGRDHCSRVGAAK
jgi:hypothetical protein